MFSARTRARGGVDAVLAQPELVPGAVSTSVTPASSAVVTTPSASSGSSLRDEVADGRGAETQA